MSDLKQKDYDDIKGWQKHLRRTAQDENLSKSTRRKINYRIGLMDRMVNEIGRLTAEVTNSRTAYGRQFNAVSKALMCLDAVKTAILNDESKEAISALNEAMEILAMSDQRFHDDSVSGRREQNGG